ncbi:MAG TPA: metal-dependent hydrolase [Candidatus Ozemobacteraceae bacterium]|nr:metal-dependent hydrolase [Candidatus Ozemobacteraceae bacterium]
MNIITHGLVSWCIAQRSCKTPRDATLAAAAGLAPDLDGAGAVIDVMRGGETEFFSAYHHVFGHNVFAGITFVLLLTVCAVRRTRVAITAGALFALHIACDVVGSRGPDGESWPIPWLYPFRKDVLLAWKNQWEVNAWQNILITIIMLAVFLKQTRDLGWSPLRLISERADAAFVAALRARFPNERSSA